MKTVIDVPAKETVIHEFARAVCHLAECSARNQFLDDTIFMTYRWRGGTKIEFRTTLDDCYRGDFEDLIYFMTKKVQNAPVERMFEWALEYYF